MKSKPSQRAMHMTVTAEAPAERTAWTALSTMPPEVQVSSTTSTWPAGRHLATGAEEVGHDLLALRGDAGRMVEHQFGLEPEDPYQVAERMGSRPVLRRWHGRPVGDRLADDLLRAGCMTDEGALQEQAHDQSVFGQRYPGLVAVHQVTGLGAVGGVGHEPGEVRQPVAVDPSALETLRESGIGGTGAAGTATIGAERVPQVRTGKTLEQEGEVDRPRVLHAHVVARIRSRRAPLEVHSI